MPPDQEPAQIAATRLRGAASGLAPAPGPVAVALSCTDPRAEEWFARALEGDDRFVVGPLREDLADVAGSPIVDCIVLERGASAAAAVRAARALRPEAAVVVLTEPKHVPAALGAGADDVLVRTTATDDEARLVVATAVDRAGSRRGQRELIKVQRIILDSSSVGLALISADLLSQGRIIEVNPAFAALLGVSRSEARGRGLTDFLLEEVERTEPCRLEEVLSGRRDEAEGERRVSTARAEIRVCRYTATLVPAAGGAPRSAVVSLTDITDWRALQATRDSVEAYEQSPMPVSFFDIHGRCVRANAAYAEAVGVEIEELDGRPWTEAIHEEDRAAAAATLERMVAGGRSLVRVRTVRPDGSEAVHELLLVASVGPDQEFRGFHAFLRDLDDVLRAERHRDIARQCFQRVTEATSDGVWMIDHQGRTTFTNQRFQELVGSDAAALYGRPVSDLVAGPAGTVGELSDMSGDEVSLCRVDGAESRARVFATVLHDIEGAAGVLATVIPVEARAGRDRPPLGAQREPVTGLLAREPFEREVNLALEAGGDGGGGGTAVLIFDIDAFQSLNETIGRSGADELLAAVARRVEAQLDPSAVIARLGGDEFAVLCRRVGDAQATSAVAERLVAALVEPFGVAGGPVKLSACVGAASTVDCDVRPADLIRDADLALEQAKRRGRGRVELFDLAMRRRAQRQLEQETDLGQAIVRDQLRVVYAPIVSIEDGAVVGVEAQLRWHHPGRGTLAAHEFAELAGHSGEALALGEILMGAALRQAMQWNSGREGAAWTRVTFDVNLEQLEDPGLVERFSRALAESGVKPFRPGVEIPEEAFTASATSAVSAMLAQLKALGVRIVMDDWEGGLAAGPALHAHALDVIKLGRHLTDDLRRDDPRWPVLRAVVEMADELGIAVVALGADSHEKTALFADLGCRYAQGPIFGPAMPGELVEQWVDRWPATRAPVPDRVRPEPDSSVTSSAAGALLGVSSSTIRRWIDVQRIVAYRTAGGHRRIPLAEVRRLARELGPAVRLNEVDLPDRPLPALSELLGATHEQLLEIVLNSTYQPHSRGWFGEPKGMCRLSVWFRLLATACTRGRYSEALDASTALFKEARRTAGLLECQTFVERLSWVVARELRTTEAGRDELPQAQRLLAAMRRTLLSGEDLGD